jgi:2'-5' RNA ligase
MPAAAPPTLRAFVALDLEAMSLRRVARVADRLRMGSGAPSASWTPAPKMHVTVKFLGEFPRPAIEALAQAIGRLALGKAAPRPGGFRLHAFPSLEAAEVVVALLDDPMGDVAKLAGRVDKLAGKHGVAPEKRAFRPHVTLARLKMPYDVRRWLRPELAPGTDACSVSRLTLFESQPGEHGATYLPLASFVYVGTRET